MAREIRKLEPGMDLVPGDFGRDLVGCVLEVGCTRNVYGTQAKVTEFLKEDVIGGLPAALHVVIIDKEGKYLYGRDITAHDIVLYKVVKVSGFI